MNPWLPITLLGTTLLILTHEWVRSRRESRQQTLDLLRAQAHRDGYQAGYLVALHGASEFRAADKNLHTGSNRFYGFGQTCRGCQRPCSVVISRKSEYWRCGACRTLNASPLPRENSIV